MARSEGQGFEGGEVAEGEMMGQGAGAVVGGVTDGDAGETSTSMDVGVGV